MLVAAAFAAYAFVPSALSAHLLAIFGRTGIDAATVVFIGTLFGPAQVRRADREFAFGRNMHPLDGRALRGRVCWCWRSRCWRCSAFRSAVAAAFALMFGAANGLITIARGAVPLALFGADGYGRADRPHRRALAGDAVVGAAGDGLRRRADIRSGALALVAAASRWSALACFAAIRRASENVEPSGAAEQPSMSSCVEWPRSPASFGPLSKAIAVSVGSGRPRRTA